MRENTDDAYIVFCDVILSRVVGIDEWKRECSKKAISDFVTLGDEAFGLLLLENSWKVWKQAAADGAMEETADGDDGKTLYTLNGPGTKKNGGWKKEGLQRYVDLVAMVKTDRISDDGRFEHLYKASALEKAISSKKKRKFHQEQTEEDDLVMHFD